MTRVELPETLALADPALAVSSEQEAAHLARARAVFDARVAAAADVTAAAALPLHGRRRGLVFAMSAVAFVTAPLVAVVAVPMAGQHFGARTPLVGAADADAALTCGGGATARPVSVQDVGTAYLPTDLPSGWKVTGLTAQAVIRKDSAWCSTPALLLAEQAADGRVTGTIEVVGPVVELNRAYGAPIGDTVAGAPADRYDFPAHRRHVWVVRGDAGRVWQVAVTGYDLEKAQVLASTVRLSGTQASWPATGAGTGPRVVHQRPAEEHSSPAGRRRTDWIVLLESPEGPTHLFVSEHGAARTAASMPHVGSRPLEIDGRRAVVHERPVGVSVDVTPQISANLQARDSAAALRLLSSLRPVPVTTQMVADLETAASQEVVQR